MDENKAKQFQQGVTIAAAEAQALAPIVSIFNPGVGAAMQILAPIAATFIVSTSNLIIEWNKDMTIEDMIKALQESKSQFWPEPPPIV